MTDTQYTREIVCPHCGYEFNDSWEYGRNCEGDLGVITCGECDKEFNAHRVVTIEYCTEVIFHD